jgi:hypothetical protein
MAQRTIKAKTQKSVAAKKKRPSRAIGSKKKAIIAKPTARRSVMDMRRGAKKTAKSKSRFA